MERSAIRDCFVGLPIPDYAEPVIGRAFAQPVGSIRATFGMICRDGQIRPIFLKVASRTRYEAREFACAQTAICLTIST
jgi:hypothetical protein